MILSEQAFAFRSLFGATPNSSVTVASTYVMQNTLSSYNALFFAEPSVSVTLFVGLAKIQGKEARFGIRNVFLSCTGKISVGSHRIDRFSKPKRQGRAVFPDAGPIIHIQIHVYGHAATAAERYRDILYCDISYCSGIIVSFSTVK